MDGWTEHRFVAYDGTPLFYRRRRTAGKPRAAVLVVHGMGEHGGRYAHVADYLAAMGFDCFVPDLRGFGESGGKRACVRSITDFIEDLSALHAITEAATGQARVFLLGHSFGGLLSSAYTAARRRKVAGLILTSPIFGIKIPVPAWRHALGVALAVVAPDYTQPTHVRPEMLTHDAAVLAAYARDGKIFHRISARLYRELVRTIGRRKEIAAGITCPVLLLQSGQDVVVDAAKARDFFDGLLTTDRQVEVYEDLYHEILNETDRDRVLSRIGIWISEHLS